MSQSITFFSVCPTCRHQQLQDGYTRAALVRILERGRIIEGYCPSCDVLWPVGPEERLALGRALAPEQYGTPVPTGGQLQGRPTDSRRD
jgi:hypothetical protein